MNADHYRTKAELAAELHDTHGRYERLMRKLNNWKDEHRDLLARGLAVAASTGGTLAGAAIEGYSHGSGYRLPVPLSAVLGTGVAVLALSDQVSEQYVDPMLLAGSQMVAFPVGQKVYAGTYNWASERKRQGPQPAALPPQQGVVAGHLPAGHVGYAPAPAGALPAGSPQAASLVNQIYAMAAS